MENLFAFAVGAVSSYWFLALALLFAFWAESQESHVTTAVLTLLALVSATLLFNIPAVYLLLYIPVGIAWSTWRWKVYCKRMVRLAKEGKLRRAGWNSSSKEDQRRVLELKVDLLRNVDKIVSWIICHPVSMLECAAHDVIELARIFVTEWFAKVYNRSSKAALADFDKQNNTPSSLDES